MDMMRRQWGLFLTVCMVWAAIVHAWLGASPNYTVIAIAGAFAALPGALWHLPALPALARRFPERKGFAIAMHGVGGNVGNLLGPAVAGGLLALLFWRDVFLVLAGLSVILAVLVWSFLRDVGQEEGVEEDQKRIATQLRDSLRIVRIPAIQMLMIAAAFRGTALFALFNWTPFYLKETTDGGLGMGEFQAGIYFALVTGMGIISAPILGTISDRYGRKSVLVPGSFIAAAFSLVVVSAGDSLFLPVLLAGLGLFTFAIDQIMQATIFDVVPRGSEAAATGLHFGVFGVVGGFTPFLSSVIIDSAGFGSIFYLAGILMAIGGLFIILTPLRSRTPSPVSS